MIVHSANPTDLKRLTLSQEGGSTSMLDSLVKELDVVSRSKSDLIRTTWTSASIFFGGSLLALTWMADRASDVASWGEVGGVAVIAAFASSVLYLYTRILRKWRSIDAELTNRRDDLIAKIESTRNELVAHGPIDAPVGPAESADVEILGPSKKKGKKAIGAWDAYVRMFQIAMMAPALFVILAVAGILNA